MSEEQIAAMRRDLREVADWNLSRGIWSETDLREFGLDIKRCIDMGNAEGLAYWQRTILEDIEFIRCLKSNTALRVRAFEASIKAGKEKQA